MAEGRGAGGEEGGREGGRETSTEPRPLRGLLASK
jgi:hypothetical protein